MEAKETQLNLNNASFKYPSGENLFENIKLSLFAGSKTAIVGINGSGKSTILKILAGLLPLEEGSISCEVSRYYVPQIDLTLQLADSHVFEYIQERYENWWEVLETFNKVFGTELDGDTKLNSISGGELMKLNLAIAFAHAPEIILMDEPTNHLDIKSIESLINYLKTLKTSLVVVSHDIFFLDQVVNTIWEIESKAIAAYGGNYTFYKEQKALHLRGLQKRYNLAEEKLKHAEELALKEEEKRARKASSAKMAFIKGSMDKDSYQVGKNSASAAQKGRQNMLVDMKAEAEAQMEELETEKRKLAYINMKNTTGNQGKTLISIDHADVLIKGKPLVKDISAEITYGDRILIAGSNGSGKTSFIKGLLNKDSDITLKGNIIRNDTISAVYVDQSYSIIKPHFNLIENLMSFDKNMPEWKAKEQLGKFQFKTEHEMFNKKGTDLSGGEMARLMMAMVTSYPIDMLVLDEPTNNLDVETIEVLEKALNTFVGSLIIISHNINFLNNIHIQTAYIIKNGKFKLMNNNPSSKEAFYKEITL